MGAFHNRENRLVTVLIGECTGRMANEALGLGWGRMWIARGRNIYTTPTEPWGFDNGAFRDWAKQIPFDKEKYLISLDRALQQKTLPYLAVVPDSPVCAKSTLKMFDYWMPRLPLHFPWYIAVQDGMTPKDVEDLPISGVFLGGSNSYKSSALDWRNWTKDNSLPFHYGRCGTPNKIAHALEVQADSIDSAFPMWTKARWKFFVECVLNGPPQLSLF